ncbi:MAG: hypothetical protein FJX72_08685 [Armatimonadetes bacterium]|nr:hypothetical protein [Armatimonadota bacterium]
MATAVQLYNKAVRELPRSEQLRLAALILDDIVRREDRHELDWDWDDEDLRDVTIHALAYADSRFGNADDLV